MTHLELIRRIREWRRLHGYTSSFAWASGVVNLLIDLGLVKLDGEGNVKTLIPE